MESPKKWAAEVAKCIGTLASVFNFECDELAVEAYRMGLEGVASSAIRKATAAILQSPDWKFMPKPGELRSLALTGGQKPEQLTDAAWVALGKAIDRYGSTKSVNFHDAMLNATVKILGGWPRCCQMGVEEFEKWFRKDFVNTYTRFLLHGCPQDLSGYLIGTVERENGQWVGVPCLREGKVYQLPSPEDVDVHYVPLLASPPAREQLTHRPENLPRLELKKA